MAIVRLHFLGATRTVTGSQYLLETDRARGTVVTKMVSRDRDHRIDSITQTEEPLRAEVSYTPGLRHVPVDAATLKELGL